MWPAARAAELADEVARVLKGAMRPIAGKLAERQERIDLPLAELPPRSHWEELVKKGSYIGYHAQVQLAALDRGEKLPTSVSYPIMTWNFGDSLAMVFLPGEVVVDYAQRLKREARPRPSLDHRLCQRHPLLHPLRAGLEGRGLRGGRGDDLLQQAGPLRGRHRAANHRRRASAPAQKIRGEAASRTRSAAPLAPTIAAALANSQRSASSARRRRAADDRPGRDRLRPRRLPVDVRDARLSVGPPRQFRARRPRAYPPRRRRRWRL